MTSLQYTFSGELPPACRALYETVLSCELDTEFETGTMESRLSDAIRWVTVRAANERSRNVKQAQHDHAWLLAALHAPEQELSPHHPRPRGKGVPR